MAYLNERDPFTRATMQRLADRHLEITRELHTELANKIINTLGKSINKKG